MQQAKRFIGPSIERPDPLTNGEFTREEVVLANRNRGMPLEGLRHDITPSGMHYLLVHFDIPRVEVAGWRLEIGGLVERPMSLSLDDLKQRPRTTPAVTMECAGNGRALLSPRPVSQPWHVEVVSTAERNLDWQMTRWRCSSAASTGACRRT